MITVWSGVYDYKLQWNPTESDSEHLLITPIQGIPPTDGSSVALSIQIAMSQAQNHGNVQRIAAMTGRQRRYQMLNAMVEFNRQFLEGGDICCPCWLNDMPHTHGVSDCTAAATNWMLNQSLYRKFKSLWSIPQGACWHCGQLQVCPLISFYRGYYNTSVKFKTQSHTSPP